MKVIDVGGEEVKPITDLPADMYEKTQDGNIVSIPKVEVEGDKYLEKRYMRFDPITGERVQDEVVTVYLDQLIGRRDALTKELAAIEADIAKIEAGITAEQHK